jgi:hypothetical protein
VSDGRERTVFSEDRDGADAMFEIPTEAVLLYDIGRSTASHIGETGVEVSPGDVAIGDANGVVVVPQDIAVDVLGEAEEIEEAEDELRETVRSGVGVLDAFEHHGMFNAIM